MPTQEERLTALEKTFATFRQEAGTHIKETEENTTIMLGVMRSQGQDIRKIFQRLETVDSHLNNIEDRFSPLERKLDTHTALLNEHTTLLTQILERLPKAP